MGQIHSANPFYQCMWLVKCIIIVIWIANESSCSLLFTCPFQRWNNSYSVNDWVKKCVLFSTFQRIPFSGLNNGSVCWWKNVLSRLQRSRFNSALLLCYLLLLFCCCDLIAMPHYCALSVLSTEDNSISYIETRSILMLSTVVCMYSFTRLSLVLV